MLLHPQHSGTTLRVLSAWLLWRSQVNIFTILLSRNNFLEWFSVYSVIVTCLCYPVPSRNNGTCYRQCQGRSVLLSSTSSTTIPLSSSLGWRSGTEGKGGLSHCLWVLSVTENLAPCLPRQFCPPVALTLHPDSHTHCKVSSNKHKLLNSSLYMKLCSWHSVCFIFQSSYVYVFDGLPRFLGNGVVHSDHNLIGAFCGTTRTQPITVEATSGLSLTHWLINTQFRLQNQFTYTQSLSIV